MTESEERMLVAISRLAADRSRLDMLAERVLERGGAVADLLLAAALEGPGRREAWLELRAVLERREFVAGAFGLLDLVTEVRQVEKVRRGEPRTWHWPTVETSG